MRVALLVGVLVVVSGAMRVAMAGEDVVAASDVRAAAARALTPLVATARSWPDKRKCFSCHHQGAAIQAIVAARDHGVPLDVAAGQDVIRRGLSMLVDLDRAVQASRQIDPSLDSGSMLLAASLAGIPANGATTAYAKLIAARQKPDGRWITIDVRPPQSWSEVTATAVAATAIATYLPDARRAERDELLTRARQWLSHAPVRDTEDRASRIFGVKSSGASQDVLRPLAGELASQQRPDGGWAQTPTRSSDAYATGEALVALRRAGVDPAETTYQRGLRFLLQTQLPDGTWHVETRLHEPDMVSPPYFETGFPHGVDQVISCMATAWAVTALAEALPAVTPSAPLIDAHDWAIKDEPVWAATALVGTAEDLARRLDAGLEANASTPGGTSVLMMAAADPAKVRLLLARGAHADARAETGYTAVMVAANFPGATDTVRLLLEAGASAAPGDPKPVNETSPLSFAIWSGDTDTVRLLTTRGATLPTRIGLAVGTATPLDIATFQHDSPMIRHLASLGADVNGIDEVGLSPLGEAALANDVASLQTLMALGAKADLLDQSGQSALMHAAQIDFGDTAVVEALVKAGADPRVKNPDGKSSVDLAKRYGHDAILKVLERVASSSQ
jgi:ankyrin repeat protein